MFAFLFSAFGQEPVPIPDCIPTALIECPDPFSLTVWLTGVGSILLLWAVFSGAVTFSTDVVKTALRNLVHKTPLPDWLGLQGGASLIAAVLIAYGIATNFDIVSVANTIEMFEALPLPPEMMDFLLTVAGAFGAKYLHEEYGNPITVSGPAWTRKPKAPPAPPVP